MDFFDFLSGDKSARRHIRLSGVLRGWAAPPAPNTGDARRANTATATKRMMYSRCSIKRTP